MRAVLVTAFGTPPELTRTADPSCPTDGVVVAVEATGLCRSDWHGWMGHDSDIGLPHVPGHELAGTIVDVGPQVTRWRVDDRVTTPFVLACGRCRTCARGDAQVCEQQVQPGFTQWGSFAELVALPRADLNLVRIPDEMPADVAAGLGCRFATAYRAIARVARVKPGEWVVVHGCGGVGLAAVMVAVSFGARVLAVDPSAASLTLAAELGATAVASGPTVDLADRILDATQGGADVSLDAFGSRSILAVSVASLRPGGRHVQVGLLGGDDAHPRVDIGRVIAHELALLGSHGMAAADYPEMLARVTDGTLDPARLVHDRVGLGEAGARLAALGEPGAGAGGVTIIRPDLG